MTSRTNTYWIRRVGRSDLVSELSRRVSNLRMTEDSDGGGLHFAETFRRQMIDVFGSFDKFHSCITSTGASSSGGISHLHGVVPTSPALMREEPRSTSPTTIHMLQSMQNLVDRSPLQPPVFRKELMSTEPSSSTSRPQFPVENDENKKSAKRRHGERTTESEERDRKRRSHRPETDDDTETSRDSVGVGVRIGKREKNRMKTLFGEQPLRDKKQPPDKGTPDSGVSGVLSAENGGDDSLLTTDMIIKILSEVPPQLSPPRLSRPTDVSMLTNGGVITPPRRPLEVQAERTRLEQEKLKREEKKRKEQEERAEKERRRKEKEQEEAEKRRREKEELREKLEKEKREREEREREEKEEKERKEREEREKLDRERRLKEEKERKEREEKERRDAEERERKEKKEREEKERREKEEREQKEREDRERKEKEERERKEKEERLRKEKEAAREKEELVRKEREKKEEKEREKARKQKEKEKRRKEEEKEKEKRKEKEKEKRKSGDSAGSRGGTGTPSPVLEVSRGKVVLDLASLTPGDLSRLRAIVESRNNNEPKKAKEQLPITKAKGTSSAAPVNSKKSKNVKIEVKEEVKRNGVSVVKKNKAKKNSSSIREVNGDNTGVVDMDIADSSDDKEKTDEEEKERKRIEKEKKQKKKDREREREKERAKEAKEKEREKDKKKDHLKIKREIASPSPSPVPSLKARETASASPIPKSKYLISSGASPSAVDVKLKHKHLNGRASSSLSVRTGSPLPSTSTASGFTCALFECTPRKSTEVEVPLNCTSQEAFADYYQKRAKDLKHQADGEEDKVIRMLLYLECVVYFLQSADYLDAAKYGSVIKDTNMLIKFVTVNFLKSHSLTALHMHYRNRLKELSLKTQAVLQYHMYEQKSKQVLKQMKMIEQLDKQVEKIQDNNVTNTPSPASTSTSVERVSMPTVLYNIQKQQIKSMSSLVYAHSTWTDASADSTALEMNFMHKIDTMCGHLMVNSPLALLRTFILTSVNWLKAEFELERTRPPPPMPPRTPEPPQLTTTSTSSRNTPTPTTRR